MAGVLARTFETSGVVAGRSVAGRVGRQRLERALEERRGLEEGEEFKPIRRGWCLGEELAETAEELAELIIAEELKLGRWQEADLKTRSKGDSVKVALRRACGRRRR